MSALQCYTRYYNYVVSDQQAHHVAHYWLRRWQQIMDKVQS